jgi:hypothetical protein
MLQTNWTTTVLNYLTNVLSQLLRHQEISQLDATQHDVTLEASVAQHRASNTCVGQLKPQFLALERRRAPIRLDQLELGMVRRHRVRKRKEELA